MPCHALVTLCYDKKTFVTCHEFSNPLCLKNMLSDAHSVVSRLLMAE